jgi:hypothetical protein
LAINRSRDGYLRIKDGLVSEGEVQDMENEENFYDEEPYKAHVHAFFLAYPRLLSVALVPSDRLGVLSRVLGESGVGNVSACLLISFVLMDRNFGFGTCIRQA